MWDALEDTLGATEIMRIRSVLMQELGAQDLIIGKAGVRSRRGFKGQDVAVSCKADSRRIHSAAAS